MEVGPKRPSLLWFRGPTSIILVYVGPLGLPLGQGHLGQLNDVPILEPPQIRGVCALEAFWRLTCYM